MKLRCPYCRAWNEQNPMMGWGWTCRECPEFDGLNVHYSSLWPCHSCGQHISWRLHENWPTDNICPECRAAERAALKPAPVPKPAPSDLDAEERAALKAFIREEAEAYSETTWRKERGYED